MLGYMASEFFAQSPVMLFPIIALALFVLAFTILTLRALMRPRETIAELAAMPLAEEGSE